MAQLIEGFYRNGNVSLDRLPDGISEARVRVEFINETSEHRQRGVARFGMFAPIDGEYTSDEEIELTQIALNPTIDP